MAVLWNIWDHHQKLGPLVSSQSCSVRCYFILRSITSIIYLFFRLLSRKGLKADKRPLAEDRRDVLCTCDVEYIQQQSLTSVTHIDTIRIYMIHLHSSFKHTCYRSGTITCYTGMYCRTIIMWWWYSLVTRPEIWKTFVHKYLILNVFVFRDRLVI